MGRPSKLPVSESNIIAEYNTGVTIEYLAEKYNIKRHSICYALKKHSATKKAISDIENKFFDIAQDYKNGLSEKKVSKKYNCGVSTVKRALIAQGVSCRTNTESKRIYSFDETFFQIIDSEPKAYFLGILYADGYNSGRQLTLSLKESDEPLLYKLRSLIDSEVPIIKVNQRGHSEGVQSVLALSSQKLCTQLDLLGCGRKKSLTVEFPDFLPNNLMKHFLRGYFDGDGHISITETRKQKHFRFGLIGSHGFIESAAIYLQDNCSVNVRVWVNKKSKVVSELSVQGAIQVHRVLSFLYDGATISMDRKKERTYMVFSYREYQDKKRTIKKGSCLWV